MRTIDLNDCTSTNTEAFSRFNPPEPVVVLSRRQSAGKGRQGRVWINDDPSNLLMSVALLPPKTNLHWMPLAAAIAVCEAFDTASKLFKELSGCDLRDLRIKWPNDIYVGDRKLGGILCESRFQSENAYALVVGIGLNLFSSPSLDGPIEATSLVESCLPHRKQLPTEFRDEFRSSLSHLIAERVCASVPTLNRGDTEKIRQRWMTWARLDRYSELVTHDERGRTFTFQIAELDEEGSLLGALTNASTGETSTHRLNQPIEEILSR